VNESTQGLIGLGASLCRAQVYRTALIVRMARQIHEQACACVGGGGMNFSTNNSTPCDWVADKPGKSCWPRRGRTFNEVATPDSGIGPLGRLTWWR